VQWSPGLGKIGEDGIERVTTQTVFDILEVLSSRGAGACRRRAKLMTELGWSAVRVCGLTRDGYREQVRGYCRDVRYGRHQRKLIEIARPAAVPLGRVLIISI
jgi:hypothetical protein